MSPSSARARFIFLVVLLTALGVLAVLAHFRGWLTPEDIQELVAAGGAWSPLIYIVVASLLITAWFPRGLLSMVAGALFGTGFGAVLAQNMGSTGAMGGYLLGVKLGHPYLEHRAKDGRSKRIVEFIQRRGFWAVLACRVCPLVPSELISVTSGVTAIPFLHFVAASLIGMAPGAFLYAAFGASLLDPDGRADGGHRWWLRPAHLGHGLLPRRSLAEGQQSVR